MIIRLFVLAILALSGLNLIPTKHFVLEINRNLGGYYLLAHLVSICVVTLGWRSVGAKFARYTILASIVLSYPYIRSLVPFYLSPDLSEGSVSGKSATLLLVDAEIENGDTTRLKALIATHTPGMVGVTSVRDSSAVLTTLGGSEVYPYSAKVAGDGGLLLASKYPIVGEVITDVGEGIPQVVRAALQIWEKEAPVGVTLLQARPAFDRHAYMESQLLFRRLGVGMRHTTGTGIVFGRFNATPFSDQYGRIPVSAEFANVFEGRGVHRTWNAHNPLLRFMVDHVLYRGNLQVVSAEVLTDIGSEHLPVLASFVPYS